VLIPFGTRLLCLSWDTFEAALREGAVVTSRITNLEETNSTAQSRDAVGRRLLTAEAAAALLSVDPKWLMRQAREGRIPHARFGKLVRFDPMAIAEQCTRLPRPPATATSATPSALGRRTRRSAEAHCSAE
jgi:hypothetical protein